MQVIFVNKFRRLKKLIKKINADTAYLVLSGSNDALACDELFKSRPNFIKIDKDELLRHNTAALKRKYVEFISTLNKKEHPFDWWALNFVAKSKLSFDFYYRLLYASIINNLIQKNSSTEILLVFCDDLFLLGQVSILCKKNKHKFIKYLSKKRRHFKQRFVFYIPLYLFFTFLRTILYKFVCMVALHRLRPAGNKYFLIKTLISNFSFDEGGVYLDTYFHKFIQYLKEKKVPFVINATVFKPYYGNVLKIKENLGNINIFPRESFVSFIDIFKCFLISLKRHILLFDFNKEIEFEGFNPSYLIRSEIRRECSGKDFFLNVFEYYSIQSFARSINFDRIIYPFERRSWESMLIAGSRQFNPGIKIIGYQHTSIALKHTNFLLDKEEFQYIPLPDKIICMGSRPMEILKNIGNFPEEILFIGCALRQKITPEFKFRNRDINQIKHILVAMTTDADEYLKILKFLDKALRDHNPYKIKIRPHPMTGIEKGTWLPKDLKFDFEIDRDPDLAESLNWSDIVLYSSSTVSIEAIHRGIPVLYLDTGDLLRPDPLFEIKDFKWQVCSPEKLIETIDYINNIPADIFNSARARASEYASEYIFPPTQERLELFLSIR